MNTSIKSRLSVALPLCAAIAAVSLAGPRQAHADVATATALGGAALLGTLLHASTPHYYAGYPAYGYPLAHPVVPYAYPAYPTVVYPAAVPVYRPAYVYYPY
ncbi:MAG: hypothetical protein HQL73_09530 [Magnetococcales bacterium]|nr:hypothetical protein [Magnetococcales bacterium]